MPDLFGSPLLGRPQPFVDSQTGPAGILGNVMPGTGEILSLLDARQGFQQGNIPAGILGMAGAIPGLGMVKRGFHVAESSLDLKNILDKGFDTSKIGQSGMNDFVKGFWFNKKLQPHQDALEAGFDLKKTKKLASVKDLDAVVEDATGFKGWSGHPGWEIPDGISEGVTSKLREQGYDAIEFGKGFKDLTKTPYEPDYLVIINPNAIKNVSKP